MFPSNPILIHFLKWEKKAFYLFICKCATFHMQNYYKDSLWIQTQTFEWYS